jgi:hypothetical protein
LAEGFAESAIQGYGDSFFEVGLWGFHRPILMADRREKREPDSRGVAFAGKGDHGDAHPECFAGRRGAVVGEGVQRYIDSGVGGEVVSRVIEKAEEFESVIGNSSGSEFFKDAGLHIGVFEIGAFDQKARVGNTLQNLCPDSQSLARDF